MLKRTAMLYRNLSVRLAARRMVRLEGLPPTVSFTFDDFPACTAELAAPILEAEGFRGTFYLSAGLMGRSTEVGPIASPAQAEGLLARGHELGCHTYGHLRAGDVTDRTFAQDLEKNRLALSPLLGGQALGSFAFPYGVGTAGAKRAAAQRFASCRATWPGINHGRCDLNWLAATPFYARSGGLERVLPLLTQLRAQGGWLILYTHDVREGCSNWGCTPEQFQALASSVARQGFQVGTVREVVATLNAQAG